MSQQQVGFVAMLAMVAIFLTVAANPQNAGMAIQQPLQMPSQQAGMNVLCLDADGDDFFSAGVTTVKYVNGAIAAEYTDLCESDNVIEYRCKKGKADFSKYPCPHGCFNGACLIE